MPNLENRNQAPRVQHVGLAFFPDNFTMYGPKRWACRWNSEDDEFCLIGDYDFAADLVTALSKSPFVTYCDLWPGVNKKTPVKIYSLAIHTIQRLKRENDLWRHWSDAADEQGFDFPDVFDLFELNRMGVRKNAKN